MAGERKERRTEDAHAVSFGIYLAGEFFSNERNENGGGCAKKKIGPRTLLLRTQPKAVFLYFFRTQLT